MTADVHRARFDELDLRTFHDLVRLRVDVFVVEQRAAYAELDGRDPEPGTEHWWTADGAGPTAYLRVLAEPDGSGRIGRVVTRPDARGTGLSGRLLDDVVADHGHRVLVLDAQTQVRDHYARRGFRESGDEYTDEDGIPHVPMRREPGGNAGDGRA